MKDLAAAFTIFFITLGPVKIVPPFFLITHDKDQRTIWLLALKATIVSTGIALYVAIFVSALMAKWRVSVDAEAIAGGILLLVTSIKAISVFALIENPAAKAGHDESLRTPIHVPLRRRSTLRGSDRQYYPRLRSRRLLHQSGWPRSCSMLTRRSMTTPTSFN